jgi:hypothetical protein
MGKKLTYKELLEEIDIEMLIRNKITIGEYNLWLVSGDNAIGVILPDEVLYSDEKCTCHITCDKFDLTIWKRIPLTQITVF